MVNYLDPAFAALTDPTRRAIVRLLSEGPRRAGELHAQFDVSKPAISRHLRILRENGLVEERRIADDGRARMYVLRAEPLQQASGWLDEVSRAWQAQLDAFKEYVEGGSR
ncbi:MAG: winged helix-turn-helix transcriptional regulator [Actinobacteria bacterium]|nr:MAG: winged helix-turn-helix transcriptional regulator [Actinomycetota bacterium]